jgi:hypothetical protein
MSAFETAAASSAAYDTGTDVPIVPGPKSRATTQLGIPADDTFVYFVPVGTSAVVGTMALFAITPAPTPHAVMFALVTRALSNPYPALAVLVHDEYLADTGSGYVTVVVVTVDCPVVASVVIDVP